MQDSFRSFACISRAPILRSKPPAYFVPSSERCVESYLLQADEAEQGFIGLPLCRHKKWLPCVCQGNHPVDGGIAGNPVVRWSKVFHNNRVCINRRQWGSIGIAPASDTRRSVSIIAHSPSKVGCDPKSDGQQPSTFTLCHPKPPVASPSNRCIECRVSQTGTPPPGATVRRPAAISASRAPGASLSSPSASPIPKGTSFSVEEAPGPCLCMAGSPRNLLLGDATRMVRTADRHYARRFLSRGEQGENPASIRMRIWLGWGWRRA